MEKASNDNYDNTQFNEKKIIFSLYIFFSEIFFHNDIIYFQYNNIYDTEQMSTILLGHRSSNDGLEVERERDD